MQHKIRPKITEPRDFDRFWKKTTESLSKIPLDLHERLVPQHHEPLLEHKTLTWLSLGRGRIHGYGLSWKDEKPRPLVIHGHGYGSQYGVRWDWARKGLNVVGLDVRGWGRSKEALPHRSRHGYMLTGIRSPETHVLRGAVCDYLRAITVAKTCFKNRVSHLIVQGNSFSGGLALMAEAVQPAAGLLVLSVPTFGWTEGRHFFVERGSGKEINDYLHKRHEEAEDVMVVLRYFDGLNFAARIKCPTLIGVGLKDNVVPAPTVFAIANHITAPKEIMEFPVSHSADPREALWKNFDKRWMELALKGIPKQFGHKSHSKP